MKKIIAAFAALIIAAPSFAQTSVKELLKNVQNSAQNQFEEEENELQAKKAGKTITLGGGPAQLGGFGTAGAAALKRRSNTGIVAGFNTNASDGPISQFHVGLISKSDLFLGFSLLPGIQYNVKGTKAKGEKVTVDTSVGYLEIPVQLQWGIRLGGIRPYAYVEPFVGYGLNIKNKLTEADNFEQAAIDIANKYTAEDIKDNVVNRLEYGVGAGVGIELGRLILSGKYYWNMGNVFTEDGKMNDIPAVLQDAFKVRPSMTGMSVSVGFLF